MLFLYILWDDWSIFMISGSNEQLQQQLEYTLLKPDCHSWWISKMQSGRQDTLEVQYAIKFCFKLTKNGTETCGMLPQPPYRPDLAHCDFCLFPKLRGCSSAVVMRQLRWKRLWRRPLTRSHKRTSVGLSRSCWNGTTSALLPNGTRASCVYDQ